MISLPTREMQSAGQSTGVHSYGFTPFEQPSAPIQLYFNDLIPPGDSEIQALMRIASLDSVLKVVGLPDLHSKRLLESPSSLAVAVKDRLILSLSSPSPGCGMAFAATPLTEANLDPKSMDAFFRFMIRRFSLKRKKAAAYALPQIQPALLWGAAAAIDHFGLPEETLDHVEAHGDWFSVIAPKAPPEDILKEIPAGLLAVAARDFGMIGGGNHFFELQVVEEILDPEIAAGWGIQTGQVTAMYHADSGRLGAMIGRLFAYRRKNNWRGRLVETRVKAAFHLKMAESIQDLYRRGYYYFMPRQYTVMPAGSVEANRALLALAAATNYAFANRLAVFAGLRDGLRQVWGESAAAPQLVYDLAHNTIRPEEVEIGSGQGQIGSRNGGGEKTRAWVHRHNASRALPAGHPELSAGPFASTGQPVLLPGTNRTASYLCAAGPGTMGSLFSVDHGAGRAVERMRDAGNGAPAKTRLYTYQDGFRGERSHASTQGLEAALHVWTEVGLARPVARLRPLAVLKGALG